MDVTDIDQTKGQFETIANSLQFDLSDIKIKVIDFTLPKTKMLSLQKALMNYIIQQKQKPLGADYRFYFRRYLPNLLKKTNFFDNYINKVIIITDGYLEAEKGPADTKIYGYQNNCTNQLPLEIPRMSLLRLV